MAGRVLLGVPSVVVARYHITHARVRAGADAFSLNMVPQYSSGRLVDRHRTHVYLKHRTDIRLASLPATGLFARLSQDLFTLILNKSESLDVVAFMQTCQEIQCDVNISGVTQKCYNNILWGKRVLQRYAYFCAADECIHPLRHIVSLRQACQFSARKNERGVRRAVLRNNRNNALVTIGDPAVHTLYACISLARRGLTRHHHAPPVFGYAANEQTAFGHIAPAEWIDVD